MNILAQELNEVLKDSIVYNFLSEKGKRLYFPKGIVAQSDEAKAMATRHNATVGLATSNKTPMHLSDIMSSFTKDSLRPDQIFSYAPGGGDKELRSVWQKEMIKKNPSLEGVLLSDSLVTSGLTHALSVAATMFFNPGDTLVCSDLYWDNYDLLFTDLNLIDLKLFPLYNGKSFNTQGMKEALLSCKEECVRLLLNFPNNPTGYTPTRSEREEICKALVEVAETGKKILVISDDAYYGLFFETEIEKESLFSYFSQLHENIFAIKCDAATKEELVWGFRLGFITYGAKTATKAQLDALTKKTLGAIRCSVSNCERPGQSLLLNAIKDGKNYQSDKQKAFDEMYARYLIVKDTIANLKENKFLKPYPFNSGYFMAFDTSGKSAEELRVYLLNKYNVGVINIIDKTLRLAYCSVEKDKLEDLINLVYQAADELWN